MKLIFNIKNYFEDNTYIHNKSMNDFLMSKHIKTNEVNENFKSLKNRIQNRLSDIEYCSNPVYKTIVVLILVGILIYFIWILIEKKNPDNMEINVSTPFK